jgi:hypothetical protein
MIVNETKPTLETSNDMKEILFGIGDASIIFDVLRSKLYSNPLQSVCREITCNARDTMIAAGKRDQAIQITLPNAIEPSLKIRDWGEGISPERVESIFVKFGSSTKRDTNDQVGFFGLGSKSIGSITNSYTIETIYNGIKYQYAFALDETRLGKLLKLSEEPTTEINGTEIAIPIKPSDFTTVCNNIEFVCRHWETKPIIKGGKINWQVPNWILEGSNWKIAPSIGYARAPKLIIEGIEYPLDLAQLADATSLRIFYDVNGDVAMYWKTGDLSLSASREAVHLDKPTSQKIIARAEQAYTEFNTVLQKKIDDCTSLKDAYIAYAKLQSIISYLPKMSWKDTELTTRLYVPYMEEWGKSASMGLTTSYIRFDSPQDDPIYINDLQSKLLTKKQMAKVFEIEVDGKKPSRVRVVNASTHDDKWEEKLTEKVADLKLEELGATYLSEVISLDPEKPVIPRMTVFKFENGKFGRVKYLDFKNDKQDKVLCSLYKSTYASTRYPRFKGNALTTSQMNAIFTDEKVSVYGLDEIIKSAKIKQFFKGCKGLDAYVNEKFSASKEHLLKVKAYQRLTTEASSNWGNFLSAINTTSITFNADVKKVVDEYNKQLAFTTENYKATQSYESVMGHIDGYDVDEWVKKHKDEAMNCNMELDRIFKRYPLLSLIDRWSWSTKLKDIVAYMGLMDASKKESK